MKIGFMLLGLVWGLHFSLNVLASDEGFKVAFGSCLKQSSPQPVWSGILKSKPDLMILSGDNVYSDSGFYRFKSEPERIGAAYQALAKNEGYQQLKRSVPILATWDDHDYGLNDGGRNYRHKADSKAYFEAFFGSQHDPEMRTREGVYSSQRFDYAGQTIQVILLDTRWFRSDLKRGPKTIQCPVKSFLPNDDPNATLLGKAQWRWLESQLDQPAEIRMIVSSIQVIPTEHCWEKWANFPLERDRLFSLIANASGKTLLISGDRHLGEMSKIDLSDPPIQAMKNRSGHDTKTLYEVTASGLNSAMTRESIKHEPNRYRVIDENVRQDHFGMIRLKDNRVWLELRDVEGEMIKQLVIEPS